MKFTARELGRIKPPTDWLQVAKSNGISENTYWQRVNRLGESEESAATRPLRERRTKKLGRPEKGARKRSARWDGIDTVPEIAARYGINPYSIRKWQQRHPGHGLTHEETAQIIANNKRARA